GAWWGGAGGRDRQGTLGVGKTTLGKELVSTGLKYIYVGDLAGEVCSPDIMESSKMASPKSMVKDAEMMAQIPKHREITEYEARVTSQILQFAFQFVTTILDDAKIYSTHAKKTVDADDMRLAIGRCPDQKNNSSMVKCWLSRPSAPSVGTPTPQTMSVSAKVGTPTSLTGQRFTMQMVTSQFQAVKTSIPATSPVQNVLINLS
ncbi:hypothetical protein HPG69_012340, partial [Diceros bicornis minor]